MLARSRDLSTIAGATVLGWVLWDLAVVATTPEPLLVRTLLPGCIMAVALGALAGVLWGLHRWLLWLTALLIAATCAWQLVFPSRLALAWIWFPRAVLLLTLGVAAAVWLAPRLRVPAVRTGLVMGAAGAIVTAAAMEPVRMLSWVILVPAACGVAAARLPRPSLRRLATGVAVATPLLLVFFMAHQRTQLERTDKPLPSIAADPGRPNLLMIVLDTVRADHLAPYGYERITTPGIDTFVRQCATLYTEAYSTSSWTLPSHASLFTGLYPSEHGAYHCKPKNPCAAASAQPLGASAPTLAERLAAHGYQTGAIVANAEYLAHGFSLDRGFAHYDDRWGLHFGSLLLFQLGGFLPHLGHVPYRSAETITDLALGWIADRASERPFFLFLNYMDSHFPYIPPPPYDKAFSDQQPLNPYDPSKSLYPLLYDRKLLFLDEHVTRLLQGIEARGLLHNTVVIITSDHGESFGEHGSWWHDGTLYGELLRVPLYVKGAGACRSARSEARMTGLDVYHLALREAGLDGDAAAAPPAEVIAELHGVKNPSVEPDRNLLAWMEGQMKWIVSTNGTVEAYDLATDPGEIHNLAVGRDQVDRAQAYAARWWTAHPPIVTSHGQPQRLDPETRDRVRSLGYVGD